MQRKKSNKKNVIIMIIINAFFFISNSTPIDCSITIYFLICSMLLYLKLNYYYSTILAVALQFNK